MLRQTRRELVEHLTSNLPRFRRNYRGLAFTFYLRLARLTLTNLDTAHKMRRYLVWNSVNNNLPDIERELSTLSPDLFMWSLCPPGYEGQVVCATAVMAMTMIRGSSKSCRMDVVRFDKYRMIIPVILLNQLTHNVRKVVKGTRSWHHNFVQRSVLREQSSQPAMHRRLAD